MKLRLAQIFLFMAFFTFLIFLILANFKQIWFNPQKPQVIGFMPYWNLTEDYQVNFDSLDQLIYFSLMVDEWGDFDQTDGGWLNYQTKRLDDLLIQAKQNQIKTLICIASFDAEVMYQTTQDPEIRKNLINNIITVVKEKNFDGVDMDFEYFWLLNHEDDFGEKFNLFLKELRQAMDQINPELILSVDIYPKAVILNQPYQLTQLNQIVDQIIIMAYDYTLSIGSFSGPVAPIATDFKLQVEDNYSISQTLAGLDNKLSPEKVILGIPLYGYRWQTIDAQHRSQVVGGRGDTVQYGQTEELIKKKKPMVNWDNLAQSPWLVYEENNRYYQLYFENLNSLKIKFETAQKNNLGGIAFWALGYEGETLEIWDYLKKSL